MAQNSILRVTAACIFIIQCTAPGYGQRLTIDQQVLAAAQEVNSGHYMKAGELVAGLSSLAREKFGSGLPPGQAHQAYARVADQAGVLSAIEQGRARYAIGDWQGSLYNFTAAAFGASKLSLAAGPESRFREGKALVQREVSPVSLHRAARAAMESGHLTEGMDYARREIDMIPEVFQGLPSGLIMHRAQTLIGLIYVAQNDIQAANAALAASINGISAGGFGWIGSPSMALAHELLLKGQNQSVLAYMDKCVKVGWSKSEQVVRWETAIGSGDQPEFPKVLLTY